MAETERSSRTSARSAEALVTVCTPLATVPPEPWSRLPMRKARLPPLTQCLAVRIQVGEMMVEVQVCWPLENSRAAQGAFCA